METRLPESPPDRVSVVMAAYNAAATIGETLDSVLAQTHADIEVIVCDDASTDGTADIVRGYSDPRVMLLRNEANLGPGPCRNRSIRHARGKWIALVDADDVMHLDRIRRLLLAAGDEDDVMVFDNLLECHYTPEGLVPWREVRQHGAFGIEQNKCGDVTVATWLSQPRLVMQPLIPIKTIQNFEISYSDRKNNEDIEFYLALLATKLRLRYLASPLYYYRITPKSLSSNSKRWDGASQIHLNAIMRFSDQPDVAAALEKKAREAKDLEEYHCLLDAVRHRKFFQSIALMLQKPVLMKTVFSRLIRDKIYNKHRKIHSAQARRADD